MTVLLLAVISIQVCTLAGTVIIFIISGFHNICICLKIEFTHSKKTFAQCDSQVCSCHCCEAGNGRPAWRMYSQLSHHECVREQCNIAKCTPFQAFAVCSLWIYLFHNVYQPVSRIMWEHNICSNFHQVCRRTVASHHAIVQFLQVFLSKHKIVFSSYGKHFKHFQK